MLYTRDNINSIFFEQKDYFNNIWFIHGLLISKTSAIALNCIKLILEQISIIVELIL